VVPRKAVFRRQGLARACSLNTETERRGVVAMVTRVPATELNGCCLATHELSFGAAHLDTRTFCSVGNLPASSPPAPAR
jgi:hypothetical protein